MIKKVLLAVLVCSFIASAQEVKDENLSLTQTKSKKEEVKLSGVLAIDSKIAFDQTKNILFEQSPADSPNKKTPILAAGMSLVIPGAGEFYAERYFKSGVFVAVEAAAIIVGLIYDKKGDQQTIDAHNYANDPKNGWSVNRYANWTLTNIKKLNPYLNPDDYKGKVIRADGSVDWAWLNKLERDVSFSTSGAVNGSYYSHTLPAFGTQQYYELIGKYDQFNVGWTQFGDDPTKLFVYGDAVVPQFKEYSNMFYKADDYYNVAAKAVVVIVMNHLISALDAAWSTHNYNKGLEVHASLEKFNNGLSLYYYPQLNLQYSF